MGFFLGDRARSGQRPPSAFTIPCHDRYRPKCRFCSQQLQNGHFFTTHVENDTVPLILVFFWKRANTIHFGCIPLELRLSVQTWPTCRKYFSKVSQSWYKTCSKEVANLDAPPSYLINHPSRNGQADRKMKFRQRGPTVGERVKCCV